MEAIGFILGFYISNFISTYVIRCHVINKSIDDFYEIAKSKGIPDGLRDYMIDTLDKKPEWYDYIPGLNVILALKDWVNRKNDMKLLEGDIEQFENEYGPVEKYVLDTPDKHIEATTEYREYFVGYFEDARPIVIYFLYNGDENIIISNDSAPTFNKLDDNTKVDILMRILYEIYIGSKKYIRCPQIDEVFSDIMIRNLEQQFENGITDYKAEKVSDPELVRTRINKKK